MSILGARRSLKNKSLGVLLFILLLLSSSPLTVSSVQRDVTVSSRDLSTPLDTMVSTHRVEGHTPPTSRQLGATVNRLSAEAAAKPVVENFVRDSGYGIKFVHNQSASDDGSHVDKANNYQFSVDPVVTKFDSLDVDVDVYSKKREFVIEDNVAFSAAHQISSSDIYAQGFALDRLALPGSTALIYSAVITLPLSGTAANVTLYIFNATKRASDGAIVPDSSLGTTDLQVSSSDTRFAFNFSTPVQVQASNTFSNSTGGWFFLVLQRTDSSSGSPLLGFQNDVDDAGVNDGPTFYYSSGSGQAVPPTAPADWNAETAYDLSYKFNASYNFDPADLDTKVITPENSTGIPVATGGIFSEDVTRTSTTNYTVTFSDALAAPETAYISLTYTAVESTSSLGTLKMTLKPTSSVVNWSVTYSSSYGVSNSTITKYFSVPNYYTVTSVSKDGVALSSPGEYEVLTGTVNQTVLVKLGAGTYVMNMTSPNELESASTVTYANGSPSSEGYMGTLRNSSGGDEGKAGNLVKLEVIDVASLGLSGGTLNSSMRQTDGTIAPLRDVGSYVDSSVNTVEHPLSSNNISFETYLDPDLPVGIYSLQHIWFNGTSAGGVAVEFRVLPVVEVSFLQPSGDVTVLEGTSVPVQVLLHDRSHVNGSLSSASRFVSWTHENLTLQAGGLHSDGYSYLYSSTLTTSKSSHPSLKPGNFTVTANFTLAPFTTSISFNLEIFYRGDSNLTGPPSVEATNSFDITFKPLNVTDGGVLVNTDQVSISANTSISVSYNSSSGEHVITVNWNPAFVLGQNVIQINWTLPGLRRDADRAFQLDNYSVTVTDNATPFVNSPTDISYNETTTGHSITWSVSDTYTSNYTVYRDGVAVLDNIPWSGNSVTVDIDGLSKGTYTYNLTLQDQAGNRASDVVVVTVLDQTRPLVDSPADITYNESSTGHSITWTVSDTYSANYTVYRNGTAFPGHDDLPWSSGVITVDIDGFSLGTWNLTILLLDDSGNYRSDTVMVTVYDGTLPHVEAVSNVSYNETTTGHVIQWNASDAHQATYYVLRNGTTVIPTQGWTSQLLNVSIDGLPKGVYNYTLVVLDTSGNMRTSTIMVTVYDGTLPSVNHPADLSYTEGATGNDIVWTASDTYQLNYTVLINGTAYSTYVNNNWVGSTITVDIDGLSAGVYNFTVIVQDESGNWNSDTVIVTVEDKTAPSFTANPSDPVVYVEGGGVPSVVWGISELHPAIYRIYVNGTLVETGNYTTLVSFNVSSLSAGTYNVSVTVYDQSGNSARSEVTVQVLDQTKPVVSSPDDLTLEQGDSDVNITWSLGDLHPGSYTVLLNGSTYVPTSPWETSASINLAGLVRGVYNFTIVVSDSSGNTVTDTVIVTIQDTTAPTKVYSPPPTLRVFKGETSALNFSATDLNPGTYTSLINGTENQIGVWQNGVNVSVLISNLPLGLYNISVVFRDTDGNTLVLTVILTIKDPALIETSPLDLQVQGTVKEGDVDQVSYTWTTLSGDPVPAASMRVVLKNGTGVVFQNFTVYSDSSGRFFLLLNYTGLPEGSYTWLFSSQREGYESKTMTRDVSVLKHAVDLSVELPPELVQGKNYTIIVHVEYKNSATSLDEITSSRSGGVEGVEVSIVVTYTTTDGSETSITKKGITDRNGDAYIVLTGQETTLIYELKSVSAQVDSEEYITPGVVDVPPNLLSSVVKRETNFIDWLVFVLDVILENITVFAGILSFIVLLTTVLTVRNRRRKKMLSALSTRMKVAAEEIAGLNSISAVLIRSSAGLPFFEENFQTTNIDIALVSGITTAINSILSELQADVKGFETMIRSGISITSHKAEHSTMIVISNKSLPDVILKQIKRAHLAVEDTFGEDIEDEVKINSIPMQEVADILEENGFKLSLKRFLSFNASKIPEVKKKISINRIVRSNLSLISEFYEASVSADLMVTLASLMEFMIAKSESEDIAAQTVAVAYTNGIIQGSTSMNQQL